MFGLGSTQLGLAAGLWPDLCMGFPAMAHVGVSPRKTNCRRLLMHRLRRLAVLVAIAVLAGVMLGVAAAPAVEADRDIETQFAMDENPPFVAPITGAIGTGVFDCDVEEKEFDLEDEAEGLLPNHRYQVFVTLTVGSAGPPAGVVFLNQGDVMTDDEGNLEFEIEDSPLDLVALLPEGADGVGLEGWRVDFEIIDPLVYDDTKPCHAGGNPCRLVCAPTTRITPADLVLDGDDDDDDDD